MNQNELIRRFMEFDFDEYDNPIQAGKAEARVGRLMHDGTLMAFWHRGVLFQNTGHLWSSRNMGNIFKTKFSNETINFEGKRITGSFRCICEDYNPILNNHGVWSEETREMLVKKFLQNKLINAVATAKWSAQQAMDMDRKFNNELGNLCLDFFNIDETNFIIQTIAKHSTLDDEAIAIFRMMEKISDKFSGLVNLIGAARIVQAAGK